MERKYVFPVTMMLCGLGLWIVLVILRLAGFGPVSDLPWLAPAMCIASGALILLSGVRCAMVKGPFAGLVVRLAVLLGLAAYARWVAGGTAGVAGALAAAAGMVILGVLVLVLRRTPGGD
jgi:hypothetical protein